MKTEQTGVRFVVAGSSVFLGQACASELTRAGHQVVRLVRHAPAGADEVQWDPYAGSVDRDVVEGADVVANLAGAPLAHWPWTEAYRKTFADSRVATTRTLAEAVARSERKPVLVAQNGVAGYGDRGDEVITDDTPTDGDTFIAAVTRRWAAAAEPAAEAGARVVVLRTGVVLDRRGGALMAMLPAYRLGLGGPVGSGGQWFATISLADWTDVTTALALDAQASGTYNLVGPGTTTARDFSHELARQLNRPARLRVPALALRKLGGVAGQELLSSARVEPTRLVGDGYAFRHPDLQSRVAAALA